VISVVQLGAIDYASGLRLQQRLVDLRKSGQIGDVLLLLEHSPVVTLGRNAKAGNVLLSRDELARRGVEVYECDRGGDVTFHGPGQLVGYPIFDLRGFSLQPSAVNSLDSRSQAAGHRSQDGPSRKTLGAVDYVRRLEEVLICTCADFRISTKRIPGMTGVWTETHSVSTTREMTASSPESKIAALGVHISRGVTSHGFALNVNTDLNYFDLIVPCGITAKSVTSMQKELQREIALNDVSESVVRNFGAVFASQMLWVETMDAVLGNTVGVPLKVPAEFRHVRGEDDQFLA